MSIRNLVFQEVEQSSRDYGWVDKGLVTQGFGGGIRVSWLLMHASAGMAAQWVERWNCSRDRFAVFRRYDLRSWRGKSRGSGRDGGDGE